MQNRLSDLTTAVDAAVEFIDDRIITHMKSIVAEDITEYAFCSECKEDSIYINEDLLTACLNMMSLSAGIA